MKKTFLSLCLLMASSLLFSQTNRTIVLNPPNKDRGLSIMKALSLRASVSDFDTTSLKLQDLSDLLWAANGINRENGKRTAPSAINAQDIDIYAFMKDGVFLYNPKKHELNEVATGDHRNLIAGRQVAVAKAPVICLLISDISRFRFGSDSLKRVWAANDAGIVSQNISLFCAGVGLGTRPRASMDIEKIRELLRLSETQHPMLNNPVCYKKE